MIRNPDLSDIVEGGRCADQLDPDFLGDLRFTGSVHAMAEGTVFGDRLGGVRLDSGDLGALSHAVRQVLGAAGRSYVRIFASGGLDEHEVAELVRELVAASTGGTFTTTVNVTTEASCSTCSGTGAAPGTSPTICSRCGGRGVTSENQGLFSFSQPCRECGGTGMRVETPCRTCTGSGLERRPRQVKVRVPAGIEDGKRIVLKGRGGAGHNGGPPGDVYVVVRVGSHELFGRKGKDITLTVPVTFAEAALGTTVKIPTLDEPVTLRIPAGTRSGRTFRVRGRGVPASTGTGDLLVTVEVAVPEQLSDAQREAVEAFAAASTDSPRRHLGV